jgi:hypothetical protein
MDHCPRVEARIEIACGPMIIATLFYFCFLHTGPRFLEAFFKIFVGWVFVDFVGKSRHFCRRF